jgi:hypothetical protein
VGVPAFTGVAVNVTDVPAHTVDEGETTMLTLCPHCELAITAIASNCITRSIFFMLFFLCAL